MNKYIIPICEIYHSKVYNITIIAKDFNTCKEKLMNKFSKYSESDNWDDFINDLDDKDILIGAITDIETI